MPRRRIIRNQSILSIIFIILGIWPWNVWAHDPGCHVSVSGTHQPLCFDPGGVLLFVALLALLAAAILYLLALLEAVRRCTSMKTPRWLFVILPFGPLGTLIYGLAGPTDAMRESYDWWAAPKRRPKKTGG